MPTRRIKKSTTPTQDALVPLLDQFQAVKKEQSTLQGRYSTLRGRIIDIVQRKGVEDEKGSLYIDPADEYEGIDESYQEVKYERRVSLVLDADAAEALLKKKRLLKSCQTTITVLDESAVAAAYFAGKISDDEWAEMYPPKETWALKVRSK